MRNIDEIRAEIKDFYSEQKLALKDLPNILATDEKLSVYLKHIMIN